LQHLSRRGDEGRRGERKRRGKLLLETMELTMRDYLKHFSREGERRGERRERRNGEGRKRERGKITLGNNGVDNQRDYLQHLPHPISII
jgi:hypothetical protein